jgi:magnesium transporter
MVTDQEVCAEALRREFVHLFPHEVASILEDRPLDESVGSIESQVPDDAAQVLERLSSSLAEKVLESLDEEAFRRIVPLMDPARAAPVLARFDEADRERRLALLDPNVAAELGEIIAYPPNTAGRLMDTRVTTFRKETTAEQALTRLRAMREKEFDEVFLVDADGKLTGSVPLEDLAVAAPHRHLADLSTVEPAAVGAISPIEEVLEILETHPSGGLPVVDFDGRMLGVIRQESLRTAAEQEATADLQTMVGVSKEERALSPPSFAIRKRLPWLYVNLGTAFLAASVVGIFQGTIARVAALAVLMPVVAGQSGNSGSQSLAVTMRGLALREVRTPQWRRVVLKEIGVGVVNGAAIALVTSAGVYLWSRSSGLAIVIGISMIFSMTMAGIAGASIPMILKALGQDPAQSSSIFLTTVTDVVGFLSFLGLGTLLVNQLPSGSPVG